MIKTFASSFLLLWLPLIGLTVWFSLVFNEATYKFAVQGFLYRREYTFTEMATAFCFLFASMAGLSVSYTHWRTRGSKLTALLFGLFAIAAFVIAMEEVQWGQTILGYGIPEAIRDANKQGEMTLHNLEGMQGNAGRLYALFCIAAFVLYLPKIWILPADVWIDLRPRRELLPILLMIVLITAMKLMTEFIPNPFSPRQPIRWTTEIGELLIAYWCLAYALFKVAQFRAVASRI